MQTVAAKARQFPCGSCGAKLEYSPGAASLKCPYCSHQNQIPRSAEDIRELDFREFFARSREQDRSLEVQTVRCQSCGANSTLQPAISMSHCPFCGTQLQAQIMTQRLIRPGAILPFKIPRNKALQLFREWLGSLWFAPEGLKEQAVREGGIKGMYIPYWTFDTGTITWYDGERGEDEYHTEPYQGRDSSGNVTTGTRTVTRTHWYKVSGSVQQQFDDVLVQAGRSLPPALADRLEPWNLAELEPYQDAYMSGFQSEAYQVDLEEGFERGRQVMDAALRETIKQDIGGDHQQIHSVRTQFEGITFKHILLPVWISAYKYGDRSYRFLINGATGEVQGERPWSVTKLAMAVIATITVLILVALFLRE